MGEEGKRSAQGARVKYFFNWMIRRCKRILIGRGLRRVGARVFEGGKSSGWLLDVNPWIAFEINGTTRLTPTRTQSAPRRIRVLANKSITAYYLPLSCRSKWKEGGPISTDVEPPRVSQSSREFSRRDRQRYEANICDKTNSLPFLTFIWA